MALTTLFTVHSTDAPIDDLKPVIAFAGEAGAHLNVVVLGIMRTMPTAFYGGVPEYYLTDMRDAVLGEVNKKAKEVEALLAEAELSASVLVDYMESGMVARRMSRHAFFSDLTVFPNASTTGGDAITDAFTGILFESGTPVLILGKAGNTNYPFKSAVLAWDLEPPAAKAIHQSLPLLSGAQDVRVLMVDPVRNPGGTEPGDDIAAFVARHGLPVTVDLLPSAGKDVSEILLRHAMDTDADLIVMGGYGHSRLQEWLLGGTTQDILSKAEIPVLVMH